MINKVRKTEYHAGLLVPREKKISTKMFEKVGGDSLCERSFANRMLFGGTLELFRFQRKTLSLPSYYFRRTQYFFSTILVRCLSSTTSDNFEQITSIKLYNTLYTNTLTTPTPNQKSNFWKTSSKIRRFQYDRI